MRRAVKNAASGSRSVRQGRYLQVDTAAPAPSAPRDTARTKVSSKHQVTIAKAAFDQAGFKAGDILTVRALGPGRVELTSLDTLLDRYRGCVASGGDLRRGIDESREEW